MSTTINAAEINELIKMRASARGRVIKYWEIYKWLADTLVYNKGVSATDQTVLWLRGATEANAGRGAFSAIIRTFTETQYRLRYDGVSTLMQAASDTVAENLMKDLLGETPKWVLGEVPDISRIASADATAVGRVLFNRDEVDSAAEFQQNSAWAVPCSLVCSVAIKHLAY
jgi:hypothetical protein